MKVIDIYNKIANGEKVPNFIIDEQEYYIGADGVLKSFFGDDVEWCVYKDWLNEEVQIIEEVEDKLILDHITNEFIQCLDNQDIKHISHKVNEIINYLQHKSKED